MEHFKLEAYKLRLSQEGKLLVLVKGSSDYKAVLQNAFPSNYWSKTFTDQYDSYDWGTYVYSVDTNLRHKIDNLLSLCKRHVFIRDDLTETFALDLHTVRSARGGYSKSEIGRLVYQAKPYEKAVTDVHRHNAKEIAKRLCSFIEQQPTYRRANIVLAAPPSKSGKAFDLPTEMARQIAEELGISNGSNLIRKIRPTNPMKNISTPQQKLENIRGAFAVAHPDNVRGCTVIIIDDIYETGFTINEVGRVLIEAGAASVLGLVATKTGRDLT